MPPSLDLPLPDASLLRRYTVAGPRYTSYPTVPEWTPSFSAPQHAERLGLAGSARPAEPLSLYVHLPFCWSLCWYCGCNVVIGRSRDVADRYLDHLEIELALAAERLGERRQLGQLHWGGGTPTFLGPAQLERLMGLITRHFTVRADAEVAVEVHPARTELSQLDLLRGFGFNRVSLGLQDFDPAVQAATHRVQTPEQTRRMLEHARALGFHGVNFDLIYGLPLQTEQSWARTLEAVLLMAPDRLAVYSFAHVPEVLKHQRRMPADQLPSSAQKLGLFFQAREALVGAGYQPIGMDHFARPEDELCRAQREGRLGRNFQGYTVNAAPEVLAVGASAISDIGGAYAQNVRGLSEYYQRLRQRQLPTERGCVLTEEDRLRRRVIGELMCNFQVELGEDGERRFAPELERLRPLETDGLVERHGSKLSVTPLGRLFVRNVAMVFDAYLTKAVRPRFSQTV